ncbi:MAG: cupin domain-containing protein, partial [Acidobacteriota bacterium]
ELDRHFLDIKKEELIFVVRGRISVKVDNKERELRQGDSILLKEIMPNFWRNKTEEEVELLVLCT